MSKSQVIVADVSEPVLSISAGDALRQAREGTGLHIAALASLLKVPVKKLEALEGNRFDLLPDAVFIRALAASICRTLKVDAAPILALLPMTTTSRLKTSGAGINEQFRSPGDAPRTSTLAHVSRPAVMAGVVFLLGTLLLLFLPAINEGFNAVKSTLTGISLNSVAPRTKVNNSVPEALSTQADTGAEALAPVTIPGSVPALISDSSASVVGGIAGTSSPTLAVSAALLSAANVVVFTSSGESWVEATDAKGQTVLRRMLAAGEVVGATGQLPLKIVVGRANVTQVQIRGKALDLNPLSKDNVARFEVK